MSNTSIYIRLNFKVLLETTSISGSVRFDYSCICKYDSFPHLKEARNPSDNIRFHLFFLLTNLGDRSDLCHLRGKNMNRVTRTMCSKSILTYFPKKATFVNVNINLCNKRREIYFSQSGNALQQLLLGGRMCLLQLKYRGGDSAMRWQHSREAACSDIITRVTT